MAYRFNSGRGGVTCDHCNLLIDADLSFKEYEETWEKSQVEGCDYCTKCGIPKNKLPGKDKQDSLLSSQTTKG